MPGIYKFFTATVALIGNSGLISTGEMNPVFTFIGTGLLWGYYRSLKNDPVLPWWGVGSVSLITFIVFLIDLNMSGDMLISVAQMTLVFQTIKSFDIKDTWDPPQVFFVSLLQLLIASELTNSISFGIVFLLFLVCIVVSVLLGHFVKEGQRAFRPYLWPIAIVTVITLVLTVLLFVSVPRFRSGLWGKSFAKSVKTTGFSERVDFGSFERVKSDETVTIRMILKPDAPGPHYLRGMTFDYFDGVAWYDTIKATRRIFRSASDFNGWVPDGKQTYEAEIFLEPMDTDVIFTFRQPFKIQSHGYYLRQDAAGSLHMKQKFSKRFNYRLYSFDGYYSDSNAIASYLQLPEKADLVADLAKNIASGRTDDLARTKAVWDHLRKNYRYSLHTEKPEEGMSPIEYFLLRSNVGYCEHFATAMTLMLRSLKIPARLITGFLSSRKNDFGDYYLIRQSDAHSWVEAFIDGKWLSFDPTPPVVTREKMGLSLLIDMIGMNWNRYVVGFSLYDQRRMVTYFFPVKKIQVTFPDLFDVRAASFLAGLFVLIVAFRFIRERISVSEGRGRVSSEYARFRKKVGKKGGEVGLFSTSEEVLREALRTGTCDGSVAERFIDHYRTLRFSGKTDPVLFNAFIELSKKLHGKN